MRRLILEEPVSRAAIWSLRLAWFSLTVTLIAVVLIRFDRVEFNAGAITLAAGLGLAALAVLLSFLAYLRIWSEGRRGLGDAVKGMLLAILILAYPSYFMALGAMLPAIDDITTDTENPPTFSRSQAALQVRKGWIPPERPAEERIQQRQAYPRIASLTLDVTPEEAFELVQRTARNRGWQVIETVRPGGRMGVGRLEAVDRTFLLSLPDDVTVRLRPVVDGTRIDVRSASRYGSHDLGANASRIRAFLDEVINLALAMK